MADSKGLKPDPQTLQPYVQQLAKRHGTDTGDFKIKCNGREWSVDKVVISTHSKVFAVACTSDFKEAAEAVYDLSEHYIDTVETAIFYMYNLNYDTRFLQQEILSLHVDMCIFADKYDLPALKALATAKFKAHADGSADQDCQLANATGEAYFMPRATTEIREHIVDTVIKNDCLAREPTALERTMRSHADFATDVAKAFQKASASASKMTALASKEKNPGHKALFPSQKPTCEYCGGGMRMTLFSGFTCSVCGNEKV